MEDSKLTNEVDHFYSPKTKEDDHFFDSSDEFPFYDCPESFESSDDSSPSSPADMASSGSLRRRRSVALRERRQNLYRDFQDRERGSVKLCSDRVQLTSDIVDSISDSVVESENVEKNESSTITAEELATENDEGQSNFLVYLAELVVKAIGFQVHVLISIITFPFWALYYSCMLAINPFRTVRLGWGYSIGKLMKLCNIVGDIVGPFVSEWLKEHKYLLNFALRWGWGLFWSIYVCSILVALLLSAFLISGLMMRYYMVEEPFQLKQALNFDYTKTKPVAFVPLTICPAVDFVKMNEVGYARGVRVIPPNHKLQATVTLVLPESDYNRNLGIFQVRVEFLSENGKSLASLSHPCMLEFKSNPIRMLLTFFKIIPLVAGYVSESQTLNLKFRGYTEAVIPTACLKVTIEQRAEFRAGAGIPEVYDAFLHLGSELPFFKRILWQWRRTLFVWLSMMVFMVELLFALVCCRPVILPRARTRDDAARTTSSGSHTSHPVQR